MLKRNGVINKRQKRLFPDFILEDAVLEAKNANSGGTPTKLIAEVYRLDVLRRETGKKVTLIYNGATYDNYCTTNRYFLEVMKDFPEVNVLSFDQYKETYS